MITKEKAIELSLLDRLDEKDVLKLVRRYIFDNKNVDVGIINNVRNIIEAQLLHISRLKASEYYTKIKN